jgi:branched-chain amino acid aminotransferase
MGFPGTGTIWMNGKLVEWRDATIHIGSHVVHYGSGVRWCAATAHQKASACFRLDASHAPADGVGQDLSDGLFA